MISLIFILMMASSCKKFLEEKPDDKLVVISTSNDMQALLDNHPKMSFSDQAVSEISADSYYMTDAVFNARKETERNQHIWAPANVFEPQFNAWTDTYAAIYIANLVLERADALEGGIADKNALNLVRAQARFHRARQFLNALAVWAPEYNPATAEKDAGIPLRMDPDFNLPSKRSSVSESYQAVLTDLKAALPYLPLQTINTLRPSKAAGYGLLARTLLYMENYNEASAYADSCLAIKSVLVDFNKLNPALSYPIAKPNAEIIFESKMVSAGQILQSRCFIHPELYALYGDNDLRKTIYFQKNTIDYVFKGNYEGDGSFFNGIAVDEMLLIRAECRARTNQLAESMADLNLLRKSRIRAAQYEPLQAGTAVEALALIKKERRMELLFRGLRWMDIKRWNAEGDQIMLSRKQNQVLFTLAPNDLRYAVAIPEDIIELSGMQQNPR